MGSGGTIFPINRVFFIPNEYFLFLNKTFRSNSRKYLGILSSNEKSKIEGVRSRLARSVRGGVYAGYIYIYIYPVIDVACALSCRRRDSSGRESAGREANVLETEAILAYPRPIVAHVAGKGAVANRAGAMTLSLFH